MAHRRPPRDDREMVGRAVRAVPERSVGRSVAVVLAPRVGGGG